VWLGLFEPGEEELTQVATDLTGVRQWELSGGLSRLA
jgi:hypothetical protein